MGETNSDSRRGVELKHSDRMSLDGGIMCLNKTFPHEFSLSLGSNVKWAAIVEANILHE
jgi:hypothetical protein